MHKSLRGLHIINCDMHTVGAESSKKPRRSIVDLDAPPEDNSDPYDALLHHPRQARDAASTEGPALVRNNDMAHIANNVL